MKTVTTLISFSLCCLAWGGPRNNPQNELQLERQAQRLNRISTRLQDDVANLNSMRPGPQKRQLKRDMKDKLQRLMNVAERMSANIRLPGQGGGPVGPGHPGPGNPYPGNPYPGNPYPGYSGLMSAECHIDNDWSITYGENIIGQLSGNSALEILQECKSIAQSTYGSNSSAGIKNIQTSGYLEPGIQSAVCHIDNDWSITFNENVVGVIAAESAEKLIQDCKALATATYGSNSSAGIKELNANTQPAYGMKSATCHIDNDWSLTYNENVVGKVFGHSYSDLTAQCTAIASSTYGSNSSAGIKNLQSY